MNNMNGDRLLDNPIFRKDFLFCWRTIFWL